MKKIFVVAFLALFVLNKVNAQEKAPFKQIMLDLNYLSDSEYRDMAGVNIYLLDDGFGYYGGLKTNTLVSRVGDNYYSDKDVADAVDPVTARFKEATVFTIGLTWSFNDLLHLYGGVDFASNQGYAELYGKVTKPGEPTFNQTYYVNDSKNSESTIRPDYGLIVSATGFSLKLGKGGEIGLGMAFSF